MARTLVIGYGNPLREDDGVGVRAAECLVRANGEGDGESLCHRGDDVEVVVCHQLTVELAPRVAAAGQLILLDACADGEPGAVIEQALTPAIPSQAGSSLSHHLDPRGLLAAAQVLYGQVPPTILLTVCGGSFDYREGLSPAVAAALPGLVARVRQLAREGKQNALSQRKAHDRALLG